MTVIHLADRAANESTWLAMRRNVVTASEACHIMGTADPGWSKSWDKLALEKQSGERGEVTPRMAAGTWWEKPILEYLRTLSGFWVGHETALLGHVDHPHIAASVDAWVGRSESRNPSQEPLEAFLALYVDGVALGGSEAWAGFRELQRAARWHAEAWALAETKNQASKDRPKWNKPGRPPEYYETQAQAQMAVVPLDLVFLTAKVDANELHVHAIRRDDFFIADYRSEAKRFYDRYLA